MTKHRTITGFVAVALLAAAATAATMRSPSTNQAVIGLTSSKVFTVDQNKLTTREAESQPLGAKKAVRYEAIIANWKRYRATTNQ